ncbi:MAG TPA: acyl-CoA dehydratase activase [Deltaproteobacteria bacterium]|nr:acyl-CoA dehydratase activase [Deltaproteobacteria bacterium]HOM28384.1 acyl-CoA dehydratase activase [Deltaproteobacteria bacterium]HPP80279.1 acyl-CoA dehydratase activase [Deltaproteobacteria bacterium]
MITAGLDIGSLSAKALILRDDEILGWHVIAARPDPEDSAREVMAGALGKAGLSMDDIEFTVGTGYGRKAVPFARAVESEISCHGMGAGWLMPGVRTVIDIGGQDAKAVRIDDSGRVVRYAYNDKCASGTGRFLEIVAGVMGIGLDELGPVSLRARNPVSLSNQCVVFAETEIISLINEGRDKADIVAGLHRALAHRVASLARSIEPEPAVAMTGGVAKNPGMFKALEEALGTGITRCDIDPQAIGALGAALIARERAAKGGAGA